MIRRLFTKRRFFSKQLRLFAAAFLTLCSAVPIVSAQNSFNPVSGVEMEYFDKAISPGDDFFNHVNGHWLKTIQIPGDQSNYGSFTILDIETKKAIKTIIEEAGAQANPSPIAKKVGNFYRSYTDIDQRNKLGMKPIAGILEKIRAIKSKQELIKLAGELNRRGISSFFGFYIEPDAKRSDQYAVYVGQDGTTLPDRDYYLINDDTKLEVREKYSLFLTEMLKQLKWADPSEFAEKIIRMETAFAESQWTQVELRDPVKGYNKTPSSEFANANQALYWENYAEAVGLPTGIDLIVGQPSFFKGASAILEKTDLDTLKAYMAFQTLDAYAPLLTEDLEMLHFGFRLKLLLPFLIV